MPLPSKDPWQKAAPLGVALLFLLSRGFAYARGVRFDVTPLTQSWQFLDPLALKDNLAQSLFYLHAQPPPFNLFLGLGLKLGHPAAFFWGTFLCLGLALHLGLYGMCRRLGVPRWGSVL